MALAHIKRKIHNFLHPKRGEVWMLHRVVNQRSTNPEQRWLELTPDWLEQRILDRQHQGYRFIPIDEVPQGSHFVNITIDDGYIDTFSVALPLFQRLKIPFTVYITTGFLDNTMPMTWCPNQALGLRSEQLKILAEEPLCTIGCHTCSHPHLSTLPEEQQRREMADCKADLEHLLGTEIQHLAYPHGDYNTDTLRIVAELGFKTAVTTNGRPVRTDARLLELDRITLTQPN